MFCGLKRAKPFFTGWTMTMFGHLEQEFVIYPICKETKDEGNSLINWVALLKTNKENDDLKEDLGMQASKEDHVQHFIDFDLGFIDLQNLICGARNFYKYHMSNVSLSKFDQKKSLRASACFSDTMTAICSPLT